MKQTGRHFREEDVMMMERPRWFPRFTADTGPSDGISPVSEKPDPGGRKDMPEDERLEKRKSAFRTIRNTVAVLIVIAAIAVLVSNLLFPVLHIYGHSMNETLDEGDIVLTVKGSSFSTGDIIAFYYNNKLLIKRVIGNPGDWINIDKEGNVYVNNQMIDEPYLTQKAFGECDIELPYQVPESRIFVMGDNRDVSIDSRNTSVGCVAEEQIVGKVLFKIWPLNRFGPV